MRNRFRVGAVGVTLLVTLTAMQAAETRTAPARATPSGVIACDSHGLPVGFSLLCSLVVVDPQTGMVDDSPSASWVSSNSALATAEANGLIRSVGGRGRVTISAAGIVRGRPIVANREIAISNNRTVVRLASSVSRGGPRRILVGQRILLDCAGRDAQGRVPSVYATVWRSGSTDIAAVSSLGVVTGMAPGTAAITCSSYPASAAITITVAP